MQERITPDITFQSNKTFVRNDLFEEIIKSCKATNLEFLKLKEKLGLCLHEDICDEQEFISMSEELFKEEKAFIQTDVENEKFIKEESEKLRKEESEKLRTEENQKLRKENEQLRKENEQLGKKSIVKDTNIKELLEKPIQIKSPEEVKNATHSYPNWFDKNKFKNILAIIGTNKFNYRHKIGEFKCADIKDTVNNIKNNKISEISAIKGLNTLNELKKAEITKQKTYP